MEEKRSDELSSFVNLSTNVRMDTLCDPYIYEDISVFPKSLTFSWSKHGPCRSEIVNSIFSWYLLASLVSIILYSITQSIYPVFLTFVTATLILVPIYYGSNGNIITKKEKESFTTYIKTEANETEPTGKNPFMNVLLNEIKYNPTRPPAANADPVALDDFFRVQYTSDPTDVFGKTQSQRQFITMPSTTVPNDQGSFQNWLYKIPGKTCKEGGREACLPGTDGGKIPWLNVDR